LWNVQQAGCIGECKLPEQTVGNSNVVFDSTGMVFAIMARMTAGQGHYIHLYDARNFQGGAFSEIQVPSKSLTDAVSTHRISIPEPLKNITFNNIDFNKSGNRILCQSDQGLTFVLDGYEGTVQRVFQPPQGNATVSCFTPDDQSVLVGTDTGVVDCYNIQSGTIVKQLEGHTGPVNAIACNPKYRQIASSCSNTW
jgi:WD40 repeat protein